jgi:hypothetical protein
MSLYQVTFFKNLTSSDGHPFKCVQQKIAIRLAKNVDRAVEAAQRRYERLRHVHHWTLQADSFELEVDGKKTDHGVRSAYGKETAPFEQKAKTKTGRPPSLSKH